MDCWTERASTQQHDLLSRVTQQAIQVCSTIPTSWARGACSDPCAAWDILQGSAMQQLLLPYLWIFSNCSKTTIPERLLNVRKSWANRQSTKFLSIYKQHFRTNQIYGSPHWQLEGTDYKWSPLEKRKPWQPQHGWPWCAFLPQLNALTPCSILHRQPHFQNG